MIRDMMTLHVTEAEFTRDIHAVLDKVRQGIEVVIEQDSRPVAVLRAPQVKGRKISEVIDGLEASGASAVVDEDFGRDVLEGIKVHREPWNPPSWE
jgi:antitoxin (DNA-binding transcriptional repressor) of toxin-antitoxin stability system